MKLHQPPMGWNSYDYYDTTVNEAQVRANAEYMAKYLKEYGWEYVVVDIEWYSCEAGQQRDKFQYVPFAKIEMDEYSRLLPDKERFPSSCDGKGFKPLADYFGKVRVFAQCHAAIANRMEGMDRLTAVDCGS